MFIILRNKFFLYYYGLFSFFGSIFSLKKIDYKKHDIFLKTESLKERNRADCCAKEPLTVKWIENIVDKKTIFFDIGANLGQYSLIAAANEGSVFAFEPAFQNFYKLEKNVTLNNLDSNISCLQIAFSRKTKLDKFTYQEMIFGTSRGFYNEKNQFRFKGGYNDIKKKIMIFSLDNFIDIFRVVPNAIKIDVDGAEMEIIEGAKNLLKNKKLQHLLIEIDEKMHNVKTLKNIMQKNNFVPAGSERLDNRTLNFIFRRR